MLWPATRERELNGLLTFSPETLARTDRGSWWGFNTSGDSASGITEILYIINDSEKRVTIARVAHRREVYR